MIRDNAFQIKNDLTLEQVYDLMEYLDAEPRLVGDTLICRTVCHGGSSHKLYYYDNNKIFYCYTDCGEAFDIFNLIIRHAQVTSGQVWGPYRALIYIATFFNIPISEDDNIDPAQELDTAVDWKLLKNYQANQAEIEKQKVSFKIYDDKVLRHFPPTRLKIWEKEGIAANVMKEHNVCFDPVNMGIVIPHYDDQGRLIGVRERTLVKEEEAYGKYRPAIINNVMYNHPLGFNLYNLNFSKAAIKEFGKAIVFESEKSTLLYRTMFGAKSDISVAVCGSNINNYQIQLLLQSGAKEIIIAFDKQFKVLGDKEFIKWTKKLRQIHNNFSKYATISFMFDKKGDILEYKSSPIDEGKEKFLQLYKERIML